MTLNKKCYWIILLALSLISFSCSLVKIESEQKPLGLKELNIRLLTQSFAQEAMDRVEIAADSINKIAYDDNTMQLKALKWKIHTSESLGRISFQTVPRIALTDTWAYFVELKNFLESSNSKYNFGPQNQIAIDAVKQNIDHIQKIASNVLDKKEYLKTKDFVEEYATNNPLNLYNDFRYKSIKDSYLQFQKIPDSVAVQTVGTLSEVVADASNRIGFWSDASGKRFNWKAEMILREKGLDSAIIESKIEEFEKQINRLLKVAEDSPETIGIALKEFKNIVNPLFRDLNYEIELANKSLSNDLTTLDSLIHRERIALDSIIKRERTELMLKADELVEKGIDNAFINIGKIIRNLIIYFIILFIVVLGLPFYIGYIVGKRKSK